MRTVLALASVTALVVTAACVDSIESIDETSQTVTTTNKLATNKLATNKLATNKLATNKLATNRLALDPLTAGDLLATPDGREVLFFLVGCALPAGVTLVGQSGGQTFEFPGDIGLTPRWLDHKPNKKERGLISACMFARVNANDVTLPISMRGAERALDTTAEERELWTTEEGAFYGDLFTPDDEPFLAIACRGAGQAAGEAGGLVDRDCAEPDPANPGLTLCGFVFAGDCGDFSDDQVCESFSGPGTFYRRCHDAPIRRGHRCDDDRRGRSRRFDEVITTYVTP